MRDSMIGNKKVYQYYHLFSETMAADHGLSGQGRDQNDSKTFVFVSAIVFSMKLFAILQVTAGKARIKESYTKR